MSHLEKIIGVLMLVLALPIIGGIAAVFLILGQKEPFYWQLRLGKHLKPFRILKFRSLDPNESLSYRDRLFPFGNWLRKTSLDELPQLINIVSGEMSFVGPRPLPRKYLPYFSDRHRLRFDVKPGLTGLAQINGRTSIDWDRKLDLDVEYVKTRSFWIDIKIVVRTLAVLIQTDDNSLEEPSLVEYVEEKVKKPRSNLVSENDNSTSASDAKIHNHAEGAVANH